MYEVIWQEEGKIEFLFSGELTADEFKQVIHQLESLAAMYPKINVLFDASGLERYDFKIYLEEFEFYKRYKSHLNRVAIVSDSTFPVFLTEAFNKFTDTEFATFPTKKIDDARKWVFPSPLP